MGIAWGLPSWWPRRKAGGGQVTTSSAAGWSGWGGSSAAGLEQIYRQSSLVRACCKTIAGNIASAPLTIVGDDDEPIEDDESKQLLALFYDSPIYDYGVLIERIVNSIYLAGVAYLWINGGVLIPLIASQVAPQTRGNSLLISSYKIGGQEIPAEAIVATGFPSTEDMIGWCSPVESVWDWIQLDMDLCAFIGQVVHNRDLVGGAIELPPQATNDQIERYLSLMKKDKESAGRGSLRVVAGAYHAPEPLEKYDFTNLFMQTESRVAAAFGDPPIVSGLRVGLNYATYANYGQARQSLYEESLQIVWAKLQRAFTRRLIGYDMGREFRFDTSHATAQWVETQADSQATPLAEQVRARANPADVSRRQRGGVA